MVLLYFLLFLVLLYCVVTTNYDDNNSIRPTTVQAEISTIPQVHRRALLPSIVLPPPPSPSPIESSPSPRDDGLISSSVGEHFHDINSTIQHDIAYLVPTLPAPTKHHHHRHRRARNIRGTLYWGAVYTILFGGVIALMTILIYVLTLCPACCYPTSGCDSGDNNSKQSDCTKKLSIVKHPYRNGWWRNYFSCFLSSSDRTSSTDTMSTADDSVSIREEEIIISTGSCQSIPNDDTITTMYDDLALNGNNEKEHTNHPSHLVSAVVDGPTYMTEEAMVDDGSYHIKYLPEDDDDVDHTIMVDVYRHYVYKGDDDVDTSSFDLYW
jgi:hypothetical protein